MDTILKRDINGECEGECRDRVKEGEKERQCFIGISGLPSIESFPEVEAATSRNEPPGTWGGHV